MNQLIRMSPSPAERGWQMRLQSQSLPSGIAALKLKLLTRASLLYVVGLLIEEMHLMIQLLWLQANGTTSKDLTQRLAKKQIQNKLQLHLQQQHKTIIRSHQQEKHQIQDRLNLTTIAKLRRQCLSKRKLYSSRSCKGRSNSLSANRTHRMSAHSQSTC